MPASTAINVRSLREPTWPIRKTLPDCLPRPAPREIEPTQGAFANDIGVVLLSDHDGRDAVRLLINDPAHELQAPSRDCPARGFGMSMVALEHLWQALGLQKVQCCLEAPQQAGGGRVWVHPMTICFKHCLPVPVASRVCRREGLCEGLVADDVEAKSWREHEPFLGGSDRHIGAPCVVVVLHRAN